MQAALNLDEYCRWIVELKKRYRSTQIKAAISVNAALLEFYWELGRDISAKYPGKRRNAHFFENLSVDLQTDIEDPKGLSERNIRYALKFFELYACLPQLAANSGEASSYLPQVVADKDKDGTSFAKNVAQNDSPLIECLIRIPWGHHRCLIDKCKGDRNKALFYVRKIIEGNWSRDKLSQQLSGELYERTAKAVTNFELMLGEPEGRLANELVKSPYSFALTEKVDDENEREIERALVRNITRTLTELGGGFAYVGHQVRVTVGEKDFWPDLIFYHLKCRRYLVIELKVGEFKPEHVGQLGFYMTAVDRQIKNPWDADTVGLVLCGEKDKTIVEYALNMSRVPMGVAQYTLSYTKEPPKELEEMAPALARLGQVVDETIKINNDIKYRRGDELNAEE